MEEEEEEEPKVTDDEGMDEDPKEPTAEVELVETVVAGEAPNALVDALFPIDPPNPKEGLLPVPAFEELDDVPKVKDDDDGAAAGMVDAVELDVVAAVVGPPKDIIGTVEALLLPPKVKDGGAEEVDTELEVAAAVGVVVEAD